MRLLWIFLGLAVLVLIPFFLWGDAFMTAFSQEGAVSWLQDYGAWAWAAGEFLLLIDLFLPIPATVIMSALGYLYGPVAGGLLSFIGSFLAGTLAYGLSRLLGRGIAERIAGAQDLEKGERLFSEVGGWLVALSRWLPVLPEVVACMAGLTRMPVRLFFPALACGTLPLAFTFAAIGHAGAAHPLLAVILSAMVPLLLWLAIRPVLRAKVGRQRIRR